MFQKLASSCCCLLAVVASSLLQPCYGDVFFDRSEWDAAVCGNLIAEDFSSFNAVETGPFFVDNPATVAWGSIIAIDQESVRAFNTSEGNSILVADGESLDLNIDGSHGAVEGFCVLYGPDQFTLTIYDGNTVITTIDVPADASPDGAYVCWTNSTAANVTRVSIDVETPSSNLIAIASIDFSFQDGGCLGQVPTANAGADQSILRGDLVVLDGSASFDDDTDQESLDYAWTFVEKPEGSAASLDDATSVMPSFVADIEGIYRLRLVVTDEHGLSSEPDYVEIGSDNMAPAAAAGDDELVIVGTGVVLDGSGSSDPEENPLTFAWTITSAPAGSTATISDPDMEIAGLTPDIEGIYVVTLTVSDLIGAGTPDALEITATTAAGFAETLIVDANDIVGNLGASEVTTGGNQNAFQNFLSQAIVALQGGDVAEAINKLEKAIARTDGCVLRGSPDGNGPSRDWITYCAAQTAIYDLLNEAVEALEN